MVDEILPPVVSCARYLLAAHARHSPYSLAAAVTLITSIIVGFRLLLRVYFCALQATHHRICVKAAPRFSKARKSILHKISFLRCAHLLLHFVVLVCCEPPPRHIPAHIRAALSASFSGRALKFWSKSLIWRRVLAETISPLVRRRGLNFVLRSLFPSRAQGSSVRLGCKKMRLCLARYSHRHRARYRLLARLRARRRKRRSLRHRRGFCPSSFENRAFLRL